MTLPCSDAKIQRKGDMREKEREREKKNTQKEWR